MNPNKRYRVYSQGKLYAINDDIGEVAVISCIRTEVEAEWLCDLLNDYNFQLIHEKEVSKVLRDVVREQDSKIKKLEAQLYCDAEGGVCEICKNMYLEENNDVVMGKYYISQCKKGHEECSKDTLLNCLDFE